MELCHWKGSLHDIMHVCTCTCIYLKAYYCTIVEFWPFHLLIARWGPCYRTITGTYSTCVPVQIIWWCWVASWSVCSLEIWPASAVPPHSPPPPHPCTHHPTNNIIHNEWHRERTCTCMVHVWYEFHYGPVGTSHSEWCHYYSHAHTHKPEKQECRGTCRSQTCMHF